jgi:hypothetical protein
MILTEMQQLAVIHATRPLQATERAAFMNALEVLFAARQTNDSTGLGNFILTDTGGIVWTHGWNSVFTTDASLRRRTPGRS